jgi:hypothetical protein
MKIAVPFCLRFALRAEEVHFGGLFRPTSAQQATTIDIGALAAYERQSALLRVATGLYQCPSM